MGDEKSTGPMGNRERDRELLITVIDDEIDAQASSSSASPASRHSGREAFYKVIHSWASKKFMTGCYCAFLNWTELGIEWACNVCTGPNWIYGLIMLRSPLLHFCAFCSVILFPIAITFYITWWFIHFVDGFFSPIYAQLGINIFGLGFVTSITFIFLVGVFMSSWLGTSTLNLGEWFIKRMPFIRHIYNASKQISSAVSPGKYSYCFLPNNHNFWPRHLSYSGVEELCCVYVPTNHLYIGDIFLVNTIDVIRPNLSVSEGIEIVVSGGMSMPQILSSLDAHTLHKRARSSVIYP
ncbi:hypothetical protein ZIOFF_046429 [Zingiber officinale]|uniref:Uncharacterized protein n=1 Tax=Zingiber officinale TaxID=94328 RepID=A0A8J5FTA2_ZINOF|nr:hypothetical protein ZIOFF_046429 [Zingiber officinale]